MGKGCDAKGVQPEYRQDILEDFGVEAALSTGAAHHKHFVKLRCGQLREKLPLQGLHQKQKGSSAKTDSTADDLVEQVAADTWPRGTEAPSSCVA